MVEVKWNGPYALISEYAIICDMRLITREYGIAQKMILELRVPWQLMMFELPMIQV